MNAEQEREIEYVEKLNEVIARVNELSRSVGEIHSVLSHMVNSKIRWNGPTMMQPSISKIEVMESIPIVDDNDEWDAPEIVEWKRGA